MNTKTTTEPKTLQEAILHFSKVENCIKFMMPLVWPKGVTCPHCGVIADHHFIQSRAIWRCRDCKKQFSIKIGTVMEDSPLGLDKWLVAMWLISNARNGISSYEIHRALGITQKSSWFLLHRIRLAMKTGSFKKASGQVEADEMYVGGKIANFSKAKKAKLKAEAKALKPGRPVNMARVVKKAIVMGILERAKDGKPSQMRTVQLESTKRPHITEILKAQVERGSFVFTDALNSYKHLGQDGFIHHDG